MKIIVCDSYTFLWTQLHGSIKNVAEGIFQVQNYGLAVLPRCKFDALLPMIFYCIAMIDEL